MSTESNRIKINPFIGLVEVFSNRRDIKESADENDYELKKEINASYSRCDDMEKEHAGFIIDTSKKEQATRRRYNNDKLDDFKNRLSNTPKGLNRKEHTENKPQNMEHEIN